MTRRILLAASLAGVARAQTASRADLERQLEAYRRLWNDWAGLTRYGSENTEIKPPAAGEQRVVFLGDEITERWSGASGGFFPGKPYYNRGIERQVTAQLLVRFRQDVISLQPRVVVIHGGANDLAGIMGPGTQAMIAENLMSMVDLARAHSIRVVLASLLPVCDCGVNQTARRPVGRILGVNGWMREYAGANGLEYADYHGALVENRAFKQEWTVDGFLPNEAGYGKMAPVVEAAIGRALGRK